MLKEGVPTPLRPDMRSALNALERALEELRQEDQEPSVENLSKKTGFSEERVKKLMAIKKEGRAAPLSLERRAGEKETVLEISGPGESASGNLKSIIQDVGSERKVGEKSMTERDVLMAFIEKGLSLEEMRSVLEEAGISETEFLRIWSEFLVKSRPEADLSAVFSKRLKTRDSLGDVLREDPILAAHAIEKYGNEKRKPLLRMYFLTGLGRKQAAERLGLSESAVKGGVEQFLKGLPAQPPKPGGPAKPQRIGAGEEGPTRQEKIRSVAEKALNELVGQDQDLTRILSDLEVEGMRLRLEFGETPIGEAAFHKGGVWIRVHPSLASRGVGAILRAAVKALLRARGEGDPNFGDRLGMRLERRIPSYEGPRNRFEEIYRLYGEIFQSGGQADWGQFIWEEVPTRLLELAVQFKKKEIEGMAARAGPLLEDAGKLEDQLGKGENELEKLSETWKELWGERGGLERMLRLQEALVQRKAAIKKADEDTPRYNQIYETGKQFERAVSEFLGALPPKARAQFEPLLKSLGFKLGNMEVVLKTAADHKGMRAAVREDLVHIEEYLRTSQPRPSSLEPIKRILHDYLDHAKREVERGRSPEGLEDLLKQPPREDEYDL